MELANNLMIEEKSVFDDTMINIPATKIDIHTVDTLQIVETGWFG